MKVVVAEVVATDERTSAKGFQYHLTTFKGVDGTQYDNIYGNLKQGDEIDLTRGEKGWDVVKVPGQRPAFTTGAKEFKADPKKMEQDLNLEVARNQSIQRQVAVKSAVDLVIHKPDEYGDLVETYKTLMGLLTTKDWEKL